MVANFASSSVALLVLIAGYACSSSGGDGGGQGKMYSSCESTGDCASGLQCFRNQCLVRLTNQQCSSAASICEASIPGSGNGVTTKCSDRCSSNNPTDLEKLGDECANFQCMVELDHCGGADDQQIVACVNSKGWN
jgi:hypothetical protein